jgi:hypothetical protein
MQVQVGRSFLQVHGKQQTHEPKKMIAMQMADKNTLNFVKRDLKARHLHLRALSTIN